MKEFNGKLENKFYNKDRWVKSSNDKTSKRRRSKSHSAEF